MPDIAMFMVGDEVRSLHGSLATLGFPLADTETGAAQFGPSTRSAIAQVQAAAGLPITGVVDDATSAAVGQLVAVATGDASRQLAGRVTASNGEPVSALALEVRTIAPLAAPATVASGPTDANGFYSIDYQSDANASIELWGVDAQGQEHQLSDPIVGASAHEVLNVVAPTELSPLAPEFDRMVEHLAGTLGDEANIAKIGQTEGNSDLDLLHVDTGWDARLIALAANSYQAQDTTTLAPKVAYGLGRVGLPMDPLSLADVDSSTVEAALKTATDRGVISMTGDEIGAAVTAHADFSLATRRATISPTGLSSHAEMLSRILDDNEQHIFDTVYFAGATEGDELWRGLQTAGLSADKVSALQLQGKLASLTNNNAPLTAALQADLDPSNLPSLVERGLHRPDAWQAQIEAIAAGGPLTAVIPPIFIADPTDANSVTTGLKAYCTDMARNVRVAFPTQVVAKMLVDDELVLSDDATHATVKEPVSSFLTAAAATDFTLGATPLTPFLAEHGDELLAGVAGDQRATIEHQLGRLQRLYQVTPSDEALRTMLASPLDSAFDIAGIVPDEFVGRYRKGFATETEARLTHQKAQQVSAVALNVFATAAQLRSAPSFHVLTDAVGVDDPGPSHAAVADRLVKQFPTLESMFGSQDYCQCEECQSVISPAAYVVDLLMFLDKAPLYRSVPQGKEPMKELEARRGDLLHLPLTCENTNTFLPYIDIVNEILEYFVSHKVIDAGAAHDTGGVESAELLTEPQYVIDDAYTTLAGAHFPMALPYDLATDTIREFAAQLKVDHWDLLDRLRMTDELFAAEAAETPPIVPAPAPAPAYFRADVWASQLGVTPGEYDILTDAHPDQTWFGYYGAASAADAWTKLSSPVSPPGEPHVSAKKLARLLEVSYRDLVSIVETWFINPHLASLATLRRFGLRVVDVMRAKAVAGYQAFDADESAAYAQRLADASAKYGPGFDAGAVVDQLVASGSLDDVIVLRVPALGCDFDETTVDFASGQPITGFELFRFHVFARLWKRLDWSIDETDSGLRTFMPQASGSAGDPLTDGTAVSPLTTATVGPAMRSALVGLAHASRLRDRLDLPRTSPMSKLLTLWSNIPTAGAGSFYAQLFLRPSVLKAAPVFDSPTGDYLSDATQTLDANIAGVRAGVGLTDADITRIRDHRALSGALDLPSVSMLYRYAVLAKGVGLPIRDIITLEQLSSIDPLTPLAGSLQVAADDHPLRQTVRFVELAATIGNSDFSIAELDLLTRMRFDPQSPLRPDPVARIAQVVQLADGLRQVAGDLTTALDASKPAQLTDDAVQKLVGEALPASAAATFMSLWNRTITLDATPVAVDVAKKLVASDVGGLPEALVQYDDITGEQQLRYTGYLSSVREAALRTAMHGDAQLTVLVDDVVAQSKAAVDSLGDILQGADVDTLFGVIATVPVDPNDVASKEVARRALFIATMTDRLAAAIKRAFLVATVTTLLGTPDKVTKALLTDGSLLGGSFVDGVEVAIIDRLARLELRGLTLGYGTSVDGSDAAPRYAVLEKGDSIGAPAAAEHSVWAKGLIRVPTDGPYRFHVGDDGGVAISLTIGDPSAPVISATSAAPAAVGDTVDTSGVVELKAGIAYPFRLVLGNVTGAVSLQVEGHGMPRGGIDQLVLDQQSNVDGAASALTRLTHALRIVGGLGLDEHEVRYLRGHAADFAGINLASLPTSGDDPVDPALFAQLQRLFGYVALRYDVARGKDGLVDVFAAARGAVGNDVLGSATAALAALGRVDPPIIAALAAHFGYTESNDANGNLEVLGLVDERGVRRLWDAAQLVVRLGVPVAVAIEWATPRPQSAIADAVRDAVRARYDAEQWQHVAQPIFDRLRRHKRDALVAYTVNELDFTSADQLYEYFLVDPMTEPVVQTSRLRLAMSSLQQFIQRCFLNLEPNVSPSSLDSTRWQWMKRETLWVANRKIFLTPEVFLEPEFRDDQTHLFQQLQGAIMQGDVGDELVEDAFFAYLKGLDQLARLEIVSLCSEQDPDAVGELILHVIGRTHNAPHSYFYRRYRNEMWTPWEPISERIEGDHIAAITYRDRLHLFWVTFAELGQKPAPSTDPLTDQAAKKQSPPNVEIRFQLHWTHYFKGKWSPQQATDLVGTTPPTRLIPPPEPTPPPAPGHVWTVSKTGWIAPKPWRDAIEPRSVFVWATHEGDQSNATAVKINMSGTIESAFRYVSANAVPTLVAPDSLWTFPYSSDLDDGTTRRSGALTATFPQRIETTGGKASTVSSSQKVFTNALSGTKLLTWGEVPTALANTPGSGAWSSTFFYSDEQRTLLVAATVKETSWAKSTAWLSEPKFNNQYIDDSMLKKLNVVAAVPTRQDPFGNPPLGDPVDMRSRVQTVEQGDWLTSQQTLLQIGGTVVAQRGTVQLANASDATTAGSLVALHEASAPIEGVASGSSIAVTGAAAESLAGVIRVIGGSGLNIGLVEAPIGIARSPVGIAHAPTGLIGGPAALPGIGNLVGEGNIG